MKTSNFLYRQLIRDASDEMDTEDALFDQTSGICLLHFYKLKSQSYKSNLVIKKDQMGRQIPKETIFHIKTISNYN